MKSTVLAAAVLGVVGCSSAALAQSDLNIASRASQAPVGAVTDVSSRVTNPGPAPVLQGNRPSAQMLTQSQNARFGSGGPSATAEGGDIRPRNTLRP
jgi:hypothetical protein